jgi:hypothetical protein
MVILTLIALLLDGCGSKVDCNNSKVKKDAIEIIQSHLNNAVWYKEIRSYGAISDPELINIQTLARDDELKKCQCSGKYSFTYNTKPREIEVAYGVSYLQDKGEAETSVDVSSVIGGLIGLVATEPPRRSPEAQAEQNRLEREQRRSSIVLGSIKKLTALSNVRYAQYGFLDSDEKHIQAVFGLENLILQAIGIDSNTIYYKDGVAMLDGSKIKVLPMFDLFNIDKDNKIETNNFINWFNKRFRPVYLAHVTALNSVSPGNKNLDDIEGMKPDEKKKYLDIAKYQDGPYDILLSPFPNDGQLAASKTQVIKAIDAAVSTIGAPVAPSASAAPTSESTLPKLSSAAEKAVMEGFVEITNPSVKTCTDARIAAIKKKIGGDSPISFEIYNEAAVKCGFNI